MTRKKMILFICSMLMLSGGTIFAANKVYKYRCPKCKLIQEYEIYGTKKCPNDGRIMIRIN